MNKYSYSSASSFPVKVLLDKVSMDSIVDKKIVLARHAQLSPTNKCNLACTFCSCSKRDKLQELSKDSIQSLINSLRLSGTIGVTITGGGEPLLHPQFNFLLEKLNENNISVGLVSNGINASQIKDVNLEKITWARISMGDLRSWDSTFMASLNWIQTYGPGISLAFSYVVGEKPNLRNIEETILHAIEYNYTHVRLVCDIFSPNDKVMPYIKRELQRKKIDDSIVIYQDRTRFTSGAKNCWISLLKPFIGADGYVYPCCSIQYALPNNLRTFPSEMRMGTINELPEIIQKQKKFDGSRCQKCYYSDYNNLLDALLSDVDHKDFA